MEIYWCAGQDDAIEKAALDPAVLSPDWSTGGRVHNWRNHVGELVREIWPTLTPRQKAALAVDADDRASDEPWD